MKIGAEFPHFSLGPLPVHFRYRVSSEGYIGLVVLRHRRRPVVSRDSRSAARTLRTGDYHYLVSVEILRETVVGGRAEIEESPFCRVSVYRVPSLLYGIHIDSESEVHFLRPLSLISVYEVGKFLLHTVALCGILGVSERVEEGAETPEEGNGVLIFVLVSRKGVEPCISRLVEVSVEINGERGPLSCVESRRGEVPNRAEYPVVPVRSRYFYGLRIGVLYGGRRHYVVDGEIVENIRGGGEFDLLLLEI